MKKQEGGTRLSLTLIFSLIIFCVLLTAILLAGTIAYLLVRAGVVDEWQHGSGPGHLVMFMTVISGILGISITLFFGRIPLKPINKLINRMNRLASGDFRVRLDFGKPITNHPTFLELSESFNKMAEELQHTEMLRSDFINNFSHEFKTPIVSIAGFAKLLKKGNLTEEQRTEYLNIIEEESMRLSYMATNVLNLTKVENQAILADVASYNLSEQLRSCVLLLENKWTKKRLDLRLDFGEYQITASEELLKQVWINLIDNAVKFSPEGGTVAIEIEEGNDTLRITVSNGGSEISPENQNKIFHKFYQADESHSSEGNGIGLAIVKRVTELHHGTVSVKSGNGTTSFSVELPRICTAFPGEE